MHIDPFSSSLIIRILETAIRRGIQFRVIIVDSRPHQHGACLWTCRLAYNDARYLI